MFQLVTCGRCGGFLALALHACPHCEAPLARVRTMAVGLAGIVGGGAVSMTLMACYGGPCVQDNTCGDYDASRDARVDGGADARHVPADVEIGTDGSDAADADNDAADADTDAADADSGP